LILDKKVKSQSSLFFWWNKNESIQFN